MNKGIRPTVQVFILIACLVITLSSVPFTDMTTFASVATNVGGTIYDNTAWTLENSPYFLTDDVTVAPNATLTIEPGVAVDLDLWQLRIQGTLRAIGNQTHRISITTLENPLTNNNRVLFDVTSVPWNETTGVGCIIQYALVNINFTAAGGVGIRDGSPKISNNILYLDCDDAGVVTGGFVLNNTIIYNGYRAIVVNGGNASIRYNTINGFLQVGVHVAGGGAYPCMIGNFIKNTTYLGYGYESNSAGFVLSGGWTGYPTITNNTIVNCNHGLTFPPYSIQGLDRTKFQFNNVYATGYAIEVGLRDPRVTITLPNNWWSTDNSTIIGQLVYDYNDDDTLCHINYTDFLTAPAYFPLDQTPPATQNDYDDLTHRQNFNINLLATDDLTGVWKTYYKINGGNLRTVGLNGMPQITVEGQNNTLEYWSQDYAGNVEKQHFLTGIKLDKTPLPTPTPSPAPTPTPTPVSTPTPQPTISPTPTPKASTTPTPTPTASPAVGSNPEGLIAAIVVGIVSIAAILFWVFKKPKKPAHGGTENSTNPGTKKESTSA
jgi:hypothetical protein